MCSEKETSTAQAIKETKTKGRTRPDSALLWRRLHCLVLIIKRENKGTNNFVCSCD